MDIFNLMREAAKLDASDIHITVGSYPIARVRGDFIKLSNETLNEDDTKNIAKELAGESLEKIIKYGQFDFSKSIESGERFRINIYIQKGTFAIAMRIIKSEVPNFEELGLPEILKIFTKKSKGLVIITGPTGSGKSTTLASLIDIINSEQQKHIITLEDPIEYIHTHKRSLVNQREIGEDVESFNSALRAILRQDPDVILIGEMRDPETMSIALKAAETGHLVFSTLHTIGSAKTIDRIVDMFPANQQQQIISQLSTVCEGIISQQLIKTRDEAKRLPVLEVMIATPAIRSLIRENKTYQINNIINTSSRVGMQSMDQELLKLYEKGMISKEDVLDKCTDVEYIKRFVRGNI